MIKCFYCEHSLRKTITRDHVLPKHLRIPNSFGVTVTACKFCNQLKANKTPSQFIETLEKMKSNFEKALFKCL